MVGKKKSAKPAKKAKKAREPATSRKPKPVRNPKNPVLVVFRHGLDAEEGRRLVDRCREFLRRHGFALVFKLENTALGSPESLKRADFVVDLFDAQRLPGLKTPAKLPRLGFKDLIRRARQRARREFNHRPGQSFEALERLEMARAKEELFNRLLNRALKKFKVEDAGPRRK